VPFWSRPTRSFKSSSTLPSRCSTSTSFPLTAADPSFRSPTPPSLAASPPSSVSRYLPLYVARGMPLTASSLNNPGIPLAAALVTRGLFILCKAQRFFQTKFLPAIAPLSLIALLFTTLIIFAAQGKQVRSSSLIPRQGSSLTPSTFPGRQVHH
jgi:hypothetical protein